MPDLKAVVGYGGLYSVTADGRVWSHEKWANGSNGSKSKIKGRWLKPSFVRGYYKVGLSNGNHLRTFTIHRLVAVAWQASRVCPGNSINHKNGIKTDNRIENLEWCDCSYNINHARKIGLIKISDKQISHASSMGKAKRKLNASAIYDIRRRDQAGGKLTALAGVFGISNGSAS